MIDTLTDIALDELDERLSTLRIAQPRQESAMVSSMERFGQLSPVVVAVAEEGGEPILVDGFKRVVAARQLGLPTLQARALPLTERAATAAVYSLNRGSKGLMDLEEALVVQRLVRVEGMSQPEVGVLLGRHKSWVSRRLSLVDSLCD